MTWANYMIACSNLISIPFLLYTGNTSFHEKLIVLLPSMASFFYHLGEQKQGILAGVRPFSRYASLLLFFDRVVAVIAGFYMFYQIYHGLHLPFYWYCISFIGMCLDLYSDRDLIIGLKVKKVEYVVIHCTWHIVAFWSLCFLIHTKNSIF